MSKFKEIDLTNLKKTSITSRSNLVQIENFSNSTIDSFKDFTDSLPNILKAKDFNELLNQ